MAPPRLGWSAVPPVALAIALGGGVLGVLWLTGSAVAMVILAITLASALAPLVALLERRLPHAAAVVVLYVALVSGLVLFASLLLPRVTSDAALLIDQLPHILDRLRTTVSNTLPVDGATVARAMQGTLPRLAAASSHFAAALIDVVVVVFLSMYLLIDGPRFNEFARSLVPPAYRKRTWRVLGRMHREMGGYFRGAGINGVIVAALTWIALLIIGVDFAGPLAILAFFGELVPYIGPIVVAVPAIALALVDSMSLAVTVAVTYVAIQQIEGHVLTPVIMHSQTHISPALVIVALTMGYAMGGIPGALAAIPLFAAVRVLVRQVVAPQLRRRWRSAAPGTLNDAS